MKKLLSALLAATMFFSSVVMSVSAETGITVPDGLTAATAPGPNDSVTMTWDDEALSCKGGSAPYLPTHSYNGVTYKSAIFDGKNIDYYVTATAETAGTYTLQAILRAPFEKRLGVKVNDVQAIESVSVYNGSSTDYSLKDIGTVTLAEGVNKISLGPDANGSAADNIFLAGIVLKGAYAAPTGVTAKVLNTDGVVTIPYTDAAITGEVVRSDLATPSANLNPLARIYVNAPEAGNYKVKFTGVFTVYDRSFDVYVNDVKQVANLSGIVSGYDNTTASSVADGTEFTLALKKGYNLIQATPKDHNLASINNQQVFTQLTITGDCYGLPTIDAAANEGDVRLTWQAEDKTSTTPYVGMKNGTITYTMTVNCITAGEYCFIPYLQRGMTSGSNKIKVAVNGTEVATPDGTTASGKDTGFEYFKGVPVKVTLNAGKNVITVSYSDYWMFLDKFELVNFAVVEPNNTTTGQYPFAQFAYAGFITETTTLAESPKVITKDKISQTIPANVATANVTALFSDFVSETYTRQLVLASYDANGKLLNVKLGAGKGYASYAHQLNISGLDLTGAETVKIMVLDDLTNLTRSSFKEFTK